MHLDAAAAAIDTDKNSQSSFNALPTPSGVDLDDVGFVLLYRNLTNYFDEQLIGYIQRPNNEVDLFVLDSSSTFCD